MLLHAPLTLLLALQDATAAPPAGGRQNLAGYISMDDYPAEALRQHAQGTVRVALDVDETGRVSACTVLQSSGFAVLDQATCRLMSSRARFAPAHDAAGRPVKDVFKTSIAWRVP
jgi:protein TonB